MSEQAVFAGFAREQGLNEERVESARQAGVTMTTLVTLVTSGRPTNEVDAMLIPVTLGNETASDLASKARTLNEMRFNGR
jgi:hypothetical protein